MKCLCYCVIYRPASPGPRSLTGIGGRPVYLVAHRNLSAAVSRIAPVELHPDLARIRAYEEVIGAYHRDRTVIPLRYGCLLTDESQVSRALQERSSLYEDLLQELEDCVEMGLRVLLPGESVDPLGNMGSLPERAAPPPLAASPQESPGLAYLRARQAYYTRKEIWSQGYLLAARRYLAAFAGLFVKCKTEGPRPRFPLLSIFFLVRRPEVEAFRRTFQSLSLGNSARTLLSGPWPPYNFVACGPTPESGLREGLLQNPF